MSKLDRERQKGMEAIANGTKQSYAFLKVDGDGNCQEVYMVGLHKDTDLATFQKQAIAYKCEKEALEAKEKLEREKVLESKFNALNERFERSRVIMAYQALMLDMLFGKEVEDYEAIQQWFAKWMVNASPITDNKTFLEYYEKWGVK